MEASLQHMPNALVPPVEGLAVDSIELAHGKREVGVAGLQE
jgi:hypothetical protein